MPRKQSLFAFVISCAVLIAASAAIAQVNTATLSGVVTDPQGLAVRGAKITTTSATTHAEREAIADDVGHYTIVGLVPGEYKVRVEGGSNFAPYENAHVTVTVGGETVLNVPLTLGTQSQTVTVTTESAPIETTRSQSAQTVDERQIDNLPINGRSYINFTLLNSQTTRDMSPTIGPAPNSGLDISGARARGNMVSVDGADAVDNSVNGIRSTLSQEGVQEFQMILSNYNPEYGRASGGVVNIVTKGGTNDFHGDVFGFLRNSAFQARNPFSFQVDPSTGDLDPIKQAYTRVQTGVTFGGPIKKDKTFYFFSYEYTQREETGFSSIGSGNFGLTTVNLPVPTAPGGVLPVQLTPDQASAVNTLLTSGDPTGTLQKLAVNYGVTMGSGSSVATNKLDYGALVSSLSGGSITPVNPVVTPAGPLFGEFPLPVSCPLGATVNSIVCNGFAAVGPRGSAVAAGAVPLPASYVALNSIRGNFPIMEKTSLYSARLDQNWNSRNTSFVRVGVSPSNVTGIESTSQNQVFGQNSGSRVGETHYRDVNVTFEHNTILSNTAYNEFTFQFARRGLHFGYSPLAGGSDIGVNIPGYAYFGREPYSTVDRIERRWQFADAGTIAYGRHTFKVGIDFNLIQLRSAKQQIFELDFGGDVNFGGLPASTFGFPNSIPTPGGTINLPGATALQAYGFGIPQTYIQGIGNSNQPFDNIPIAFFAQDSFRITPKLTINYGVRYDLELTPLFQPATPVNAAAEQALGVIEGIPRDYTNVAPRIGIAWDPTGDGKTVVRAGYGLFYDHPLLAIAFDSTTADGGRSVQLLSPGGQASACGLVTAPCANGLDSPTNLNGSSIFQGALNALPSMFYQPSQQRFNPLAPGSIFANQNYLAVGFPLPILPFTLPVVKNFTYGYAQQANLTIQRVISGTWTISAGYQWTRGIHLYRPIDVNSTDPVLLTNNMLNAGAAGLDVSSPLTIVVPNSSTPGSATACALNVIAPGALGVLSGCPIPSFNGKYVGTPAFFNYFRPSGPNPSFGTAAGGYGNQVALAGLAGYPTGFGVPVPYNSVDAQKSDASSWYNALTVNLEKHWSRHFQMLASYTYSHSIDNGTDLQSTLEPQDSRYPQFERANSVNDQRHRFVLSGVYQSSPHVPGEGFVKAFFSNWTVAPLIEVSSGRPYEIITGEDTRLDLGASNERPSIVPAGTAGATTTPFVKNWAFAAPTSCWTNAGPNTPYTVPGITPPLGCVGDLSRNRFTMPMFFSWDMRVAKAVNLGERVQLQLIYDGFNLFNHTNISAVNQLCDPLAGTACTAGQSTAAYDARISQFALKFVW